MDSIHMKCQTTPMGEAWPTTTPGMYPYRPARMCGRCCNLGMLDGNKNSLQARSGNCHLYELFNIIFSQISPEMILFVRDPLQLRIILIKRPQIHVFFSNLTFEYVTINQKAFGFFVRLD